MIAGVRGLLEAIGPDWIHVQVGGITLQIFVPATSINQLGPAGNPVHLYTHLRIRDDQPVLYGFADAPSLELFLLLLGVSGIGPRHSLALLSSLGVTRLHQAIESGDIAALSGVPGVGRRTAGRVVLELKGKLELDQEGAAAPSVVSNDQEVIEALTALGYSPTEARRAVNDLGASPGQSVEDRIRLALQRMGGGQRP